MPRRTAFVLVLSGALIGCVERMPLVIDAMASDDDLVIVAIERARGPLQLSAFIAAEGGSPLSQGPEDRAHVFVIADGTISAIDGETFASGLFDRMSVYDAESGGPPAGRGACGRCIGRTSTPPQLVFEGEDCAAPSFAAYESESADDRERIASRIHLAFEGDCPCERRASTPSALPSFTLLDDRPDVWPHDALAVTATGAVGLFGEHHSVVIHPDDRRSVRTAEDRLFDGAVASAAGTSNERFFVVVHSAQPKVRATLDILDGELEPIATDVIESDFTPARARSLDAGRMLLLGNSGRRIPQALVCAESLPLRCSELLPRDLLFVGSQLTDVAQLDDGAAVLTGWDGIVVLSALPSSAGAFRSESITGQGSSDVFGRLEGTAIEWRAFSVEYPQPEPLEGRFATAASLGGRLFACRNQLHDARIVTAPISATTVTSSAPPPVFQIAHRSPDDRCGLFSKEAGRLRMIYRSGLTVLLDVTGAVAESDGEYVPVGLDRPVNGLGTSHFGHRFAWRESTTFGAIAIALNGAPSFTEIYGSAADERRSTAALFNAFEQTVGIDETGGTIVLRDGDIQPERRALVDFDRVNDTVDAAAFDSRRGDVLVASFDPTTRSPAIGRVTIDDLRFRPSTLSRPELLTARARRIVEVSPGVHLIVATDGGLLRLEGDDLQRIEVRFDDPSTDFVETPPPAEAACDLGRPGVTDIWRDAAASLGRAWVVGCRGLILEVSLSSTPPLAVRIALDRSSETLSSGDPLTPTRLTAVGAVCGDDALIAAEGFGNDVERGRTWELVSGLRCDDPFEGRCLIDADRGPRPSINRSSGAPVVITGRASGVYTVLFSNDPDLSGIGSVHGLDGDDRYRFPGRLSHAIETPWGELVVLGPAGRLLHSQR